jgi:hypothetical protein
MVMVPAVVLFSSLIIPLCNAEDWITTHGKTCKDVTVVKYDAASVTILDADGGASIPLADLPAELQKKFIYNAKAAVVLKAQQDAQAAAELKAEQAAATAKAWLEAKAASAAKAQLDEQAAADAVKAKATTEQEQQKEAFNQKAKADFDAAAKVNVNGQVPPGMQIILTRQDVSKPFHQLPDDEISFNPHAPVR